MNLHNAEFVISAASIAACPRDLPQIAFSGRSNVGKSSVINRLLQRKNFARVGEAPGKTTHINYFKIDNSMYLVDLPGYGYAKVSRSEKDRWSDLMEGYFKSGRNIKNVFQLIDMRHKPSEFDITMLEFLKAMGIPCSVILTKSDKLNRSEFLSQLESITGIVNEILPDCKIFTFSSLNGQGVEELRSFLETMI
jgi:GTP-binding protein